jgi:cellulose synthase/poly-beta-1,6-N-acetylglucosamine synthase-like glycosyltransferase
VVKGGGYSTDTVGEDMELVVRLHRQCRDTRTPYKIGFVPDPVAWTECPETIRILGRQRDRWQRGLMESLLKHRDMILNPRYGRLGLLAYPYFFFLEMIGPMVEGLGYLSFLLTLLAGKASLPYVIAFLSVALALGIVLSISAVCLEELAFRRYPTKKDLILLFLIGALENLGYRQLNTYWRVRGTISGLRGKGGWGVMTRKGFG